MVLVAFSKIKDVGEIAFCAVLDSIGLSAGLSADLEAV
jgi:hypothetical protein